MNSFKDIAYRVLKEAGKPLHYKEITKRALARGLVTEGKTPEATMNAQLIVDINSKKDKSLFIKTAPSTYCINPNQKIIDPSSLSLEATIQSRTYNSLATISTIMKGNIAEARVAELITLYGEKALSCYKPIADDEGIDLIVKEKGSLKTMYLQIKSRFGNNPGEIYTATVKTKTVVDNYSMAIIFCYFDTGEGDLWDYLWFVPSPDVIKLANQLQSGELLGFVAGRKKKESNKWDNYLIDKRDLANKIIDQMRRI